MYSQTIPLSLNTTVGYSCFEQKTRRFRDGSCCYNHDTVGSYPYSLLPTLGWVHTVHSTQSIILSTQYTGQNNQYTLLNNQYTLLNNQYTIHHTQYTVNRTQYTVRTLFIKWNLGNILYIFGKYTFHSLSLVFHQIFIKMKIKESMGTRVRCYLTFCIINI